MPRTTTEESQKSILASSTGNEIKSLADRATDVACKMLMEGATARQPRFDAIKKNEDMYFNIPAPALKGRSNIPFDSVVMGGFIDTLLAESRQRVTFVVDPTREQDKMAADKIAAVMAREGGQDRGNWNDVLLATDFLASLAGVGFNKMYFENAPKFRSELMVCDHYDMVTEGTGGSILDKHLYKFQMNIFRTQEEMKDIAAQGYYNTGQVRQFILKSQNPELIKTATDIYNNKNARYTTLGMDMTTMGYVGQSLARLVEGAINFEGRWYYIVFSFELKTWVRFEPLEDVFEHAKDFPGRASWTAYHTHPHPFMFWTKAPADDVRPIAYTMKKVVNYTVDNLEKRNWQQRAYNPKVFTDPVSLLWKQDGLVKATLKPGENIQNGIFEFQTPDTTGITINLTEWLNNFLGQKTGITPDAQGASKEDKVGIAYQNMAQVSKRLRLTNDRKKKAIVDLGVIFDWGVYEYLREPYAVKIIGIKGAQWEEEVTRRDSERDFTITVRASDEEEEQNAINAQKRAVGFEQIEKNPNLFAKVNVSEHLRLKYRDMGFDDEQVRVLLDVNNDGNQESRAHAAQAIQDCLEGKPLYKMYRGATAGFVQKILDFCADEFDLVPPEELAKMSKGQQAAYVKDMEKHDKLIAYAEAHIPIAQENMMRAATSAVAAQMTAQGPGNTPAAKTPAPVKTSVPSPEMVGA